MAEGDELLDKADALLAKYREGADFPILTDVVDLPAEAGDAAPLPANPLPPPSALPGKSASLDAELRALEEDLRRDILLSIQPYLEAHLAEPMELRIQMQLESALARIASEVISAVRMDVSDLVRKAIAEAVERELSALRSRLSPP